MSLILDAAQTLIPSPHHLSCAARIGDLGCAPDLYQSLFSPEQRVLRVVLVMLVLKAKSVLL